MAGTTRRGVITTAAGTIPYVGILGIAMRATMATGHTAAMRIATGCTVALDTSGMVVIIATAIGFIIAVMSGATTDVTTRISTGS